MLIREHGAGVFSEDTGVSDINEEHTIDSLLRQLFANLRIRVRARWRKQQ
jgi:hypothetical protein